MEFVMVAKKKVVVAKKPIVKSVVRVSMKKPMKKDKC
jgi:hypothetical protein